MADKSKDDIWHFFTRDKIKQIAQCNKCKKVLKSYGGSTSSLHAHLKSAHKICALKRTAKDANLSEPGPSFCPLVQQPSSTIPQITDFFQNKTDDSLAAIVSRMTAKDGLPLSIFCTSSDLRKLLFAKGFQQIPKSANTIRQMISGYAAKIQIQIKREISDYKESGGKCSLTLDEWTSTRNRRYLNINVHSDNPGKFWNLGLVRIIGSLPAEKCIGLISEKLKIYNISFENDVVAITTDGAAVMKKVGNLIPASQQLCFAHAIQLAVLSVLYRKEMPAVQVELLQLSSSEEFDSSDDTETDHNEDEEDFEFAIAPDNVEKPISISHERLMPLIAKIRKVIKLFRLSPTRNDEILQKHVKEAFGKELMLILDSRTRWNSLLTMLERFNKLRSAIQKSLIDMKSDIQFSNDEFNLLTETISVLMPIKYAVEALCRQDANLLTADAALKFLLNTLGKIDGDLASDIKDALELRIKERRNNLSGLLQYLHTGNVNNSSDSTDVFAPLKKGLAKNLLLATVKRLFTSINDENKQDIINDADVEVQEVVEVEQEAETIKEQMQKAIENEISMSEKEKKTLFSTTSTIERSLRREQAQFEDDRTRGKYFALCYNALKSIPPTSVESERVFSVSGNLCTKLRSRLGDKILDDLCFLRAYFNKLE